MAQESPSAQHKQRKGCRIGARAVPSTTNCTHRQPRLQETASKTRLEAKDLKRGHLPALFIASSIAWFMQAFNKVGILYYII